MDAATERGAKRVRVPDPNEYLIQLLASAQRMHWSDADFRERAVTKNRRARIAECSFDPDMQSMLESRR